MTAWPKINAIATIPSERRSRRIQRYKATKTGIVEICVTRGSVQSGRSRAPHSSSCVTEKVGPGRGARQHSVSFGRGERCIAA